MINLSYLLSGKLAVFGGATLPWTLAVFDWDGTLVDSPSWAHRAMQAVFEHYGVKSPTRETFLHEISSDFMLFYRKYGIPASATRKDLNGLWERFLKEHPDDLRLREGAHDTLSLCHDLGMKTAIVSGTAPGVITHGAVLLGISAFIDHVDGNARGKFNELRRLLTRFEVRPQEAIYVDDTREGVIAAKEAGMTAIAISGGFEATNRLRSACPDHLIETLSELPTLFNLR